MLLAMRDERSLLMLLRLKYLLTHMVTSMVAALAQGSDPKHTEARCCLLQALGSVTLCGVPLLSELLAELISEIGRKRLRHSEPSTTGK